jgi:hypothetical protein
MNEYPLLFTFREIVEGSGFVAGVVCNGRALMVNEGDEGWHVSGVEPGALSELGSAPHEAYFYFRQSFTDALRVLARDAGDYRQFETFVHGFFDRRDDDEGQRWVAAREKVRAGAECDAPFKELPKETAEEPRGVEVVRLDPPQQKPGEQSAVAHVIARTEQVGIALAEAA